MRTREPTLPSGPLPQPALGTTVTLAVSTPVGPIGVVGVLVAADDETWSIRRRDGSVSVVARAAITAGRVVPPSPSARIDVGSLQRVAALGWRGLEVEPLGDWLLRFGGGFTGRANSALVVGDPGTGIDAAAGAVEAWYAARGLPPRVQLPDPDGAAAGEVNAELDRRGWGAPSALVHVMTAEIAHVLRAADALETARAGAASGGGFGRSEVQVDAAPDAGWLGCYRQDGGALPPVAREVLVNHPAAGFASLRRDGRTAAIARAAVDDRWAGLFAVEVVPDQRGQGLGRLVSAAALRWAGRQGARRTYLQVLATNSPAVALYEKLGYAVHHDYVYRQL